MKNIYSVMFLLLFAVSASASAVSLDEIVFGNNKSEKTHDFTGNATETYTGGLGECARRMLPLEKPTFEGGKLTFRMKVDGNSQNYFTVRCFGSEADNAFLMLFCEGKQIGYRHLGDIDYLTVGNGQAPCPGRFYYVTLPLPRKFSDGKKIVDLEIRSFGPIWGYGGTFEKYQKNMMSPTIGIYKAFTHTSTCFVPDKKEKQGEMPAYKKRKGPGIEIFDELKQMVNKDVDHILRKTSSLNQLEMWFLSDAYAVEWTPAYKNIQIPDRIIVSIDDFYLRYKKDKELIHTDGAVYNSDWLIIGPMSRAIRHLWVEIEKKLTPKQKAEWSEMLVAALQYSTTHRRQYTNQSMIIDLFMYDVNKALALVDPVKSLPEYQTLRYLHESIGLAPWLGLETGNGPEKPLGDNYWQLTSKGLTKELGFVGYYGEVLDWVCDIYRSTCVSGYPGTGDPLIKEQLLKMLMARANFRYPAVDNEGNACMRAEAVVGWRDSGHYPGDIIYGDRGVAWDATPFMSAALTLDEKAIGFAQQMLADNQFFEAVKTKLNSGAGLRTTRSLLHIPDEYELIMAQTRSNYKLPMVDDMPDYVFSDEEDGVIAVKNGDEILYASLYWRARYAINNLAKVHYITPRKEMIANICIDEKFEDSGMHYIRPDWVNLGFSGGAEWYKGTHSAHAGDKLPIAKVPEGIKFRPGNENAYAGRAQFYQMKYGKYLVGMNSTPDKTFELKVPRGKKVVDLTNGKTEVNSPAIIVRPMTTTVLYME